MERRGERGRRPKAARDYIFWPRFDRVHRHTFREGSRARRRGALCFGQLYFLKRRFEVVTGWKCHAARSPRPGPTPLLYPSSLGSTSASTCVGHICHRKLTFPTSLAPLLHNLPYTFRPPSPIPWRESRRPIAGSTFPPRRVIYLHPFTRY